MRGWLACAGMGRRAKLLAAFQHFRYQYSELQHRDNGDWRPLASYFAERIIPYDSGTILRCVS